MEESLSVNWAREPSQSVVSVWGVGKDRKPEFIGSAFFVAPSIVLTARHVVMPDEDVRNDLFLRMVQGIDQLRIDSRFVHIHPEVDIALVRLRHPQKDQPCSRIRLDDSDFKEYDVDSYGVDRHSKNRDLDKGLTVGTRDPRDHKGYLYKTAVKEGFSGGPVALNGQDRVIGINSQRDKADNETLFVPLYLIFDWLRNLAPSARDPVISEFANWYINTAVSTADAQTIANDIKELSIFIERPKPAYKHVFDELSSTNRAVKFCMCLTAAATEDWPEEFAKALSLRLCCERNPSFARDLLGLTKKKNGIRPTLIRNDIWHVDNYPEFKKACLAEVLNSLSGSNLGAGLEDARESKDLMSILTQRLANQPAPKILLLQADQSATGGFQAWRFGHTKRARKKVNERFDWVERLNREWLEQSVSFIGQPLIFLFCIQIDRKISESLKRCFRFEQVTQDDFNSWKVNLQQWLLDSHRYPESAVYDELTRYCMHITERLGEKPFPLPYKTFNEKIKNVSEHYVKQTK